MAHSGPSAVQIVLSEDERAELVRRAGLPGRWRADRARIILACAEGMSNAGAAQALGVAVKSVSKWRRQFAAERLAGLEDAAPVGRRKADLVLDDAERAQLIRWARRAKTAQYLALRAKIVLRCAEGGTNKQAAADPAGPGRGRDRGHAGVHAGQGHTLVAGLDGETDGAVEVDRRADLEKVRPQAPPAGFLQAVHRPVLRGQGRRRRRAVSR